MFSPIGACTRPKTCACGPFLIKRGISEKTVQNKSLKVDKVRPPKYFFFFFFFHDVDDDDVDDVVGGLRGWEFRVLACADTRARTPVGVRQYLVKYCSVAVFVILLYYIVI